MNQFRENLRLAFAGKVGGIYIPRTLRGEYVPAFTPAKTAVVAGVVGLLIIASYSVFAALPLLEGPSLKATVAVNESGIASIQGVTERVSFLEINGSPIPLQEDGSFAIERAYPAGYTAITVIAKDRFGKGITKKLSFLNTTK